MTAAGGTIEHRGCRLAYDVRGDGPDVLFVQGVGVHGPGWRPQLDACAERYRCVSFDNRGMGRSQPLPASLTVEQMADDTLAVLDAAGVGSAHVVGHSLGGLVALQLALTARDRVKSLALLCTFADGRAAAPLTTRMCWLGTRTRVGSRQMRRRAFVRLVMPPGGEFDADALAAELAPLFGHDLGDHPPVVDLQLKAMRASSVSARLGELTGVPTLVVNAAHDPISPPRVSRAIADGVPGSRYVEFADASHGLPISHAAAVNALLLEHFAAAAGGPG
ncbi:alpha/beta fold hydrolase [Gemmata sp.]|uniref:alpha/beta fold hydrolase n=1 Tax=Gemmata sp. TaxID=1914242 RepID=UPI003F716B79